MRTDYNVKIRECTWELTAREAIKLKDLSNAQPLDALVTDDAPLVLSVVGYAILDVHNEHAKKDHDYSKILILDESGNKYTTGSNSFLTAISDIRSELLEAGESGPFEIEIFRRPSRNYPDKYFITCSLV